MSPQGDYDPTKVSVKFSEITAVLYPGTDPQGNAVVQTVRVPYELVFPSGRSESHVLEFTPPADIQAAVLAGASAAISEVMQYEGLTTVWTPTPPAPPPTTSTVTLEAQSSTSSEVTTR